MPKVIEFEGKTHEFPDDFTDDEIGMALSGQEKQEEQSWYDEKVPQTLKNMVGITESLGRAIVNIPKMASDLGVKAVEKFAVPENLKKDFAEVKQEADERAVVKYVEPFTKEGAVADEMFGEAIHKLTRSPGAALDAAIQGGGQSLAQDFAAERKKSTLADITGLSGEAAMLLSGGKAIPKQVKGIWDTAKKPFEKKVEVKDTIVDDILSKAKEELENTNLDQYRTKFLEEIKAAQERTPTEFIGDALPREGVLNIRPTMELVEKGQEPRPPVPDTERLATRHEGVPTVDFPLRQEVLESLEPTITAFREQTVRLEKKVAEQTTFVEQLAEDGASRNAVQIETNKLQKLQEQLTGLKEEFGKGMELLGVREASDAYGRGLYEARGDKTTGAVEHTFQGKRGVGAKEGGAVDPEMLGLKRIGEGLKGIKVFRALGKEESPGGNVQAGQWVSPSKDIAVNVYAKGDSARVIEDYIPAKDLYEVHPDGWVYAPKGTDLTNVKRTGDTTFGQLAKGKSQRGSIGWKSEDSPYTKDKETFTRYAKLKGATDQVIEKAWENIEKERKVATELKQAQQQDTAVSKMLSTKYSRSITNLADVPYEELMPYWKQEPDLAGMSAGSFTRAAQNLGAALKKNLLSGGFMVSFASRDSFVNRGVSQFYKYAREAQIKIDEALSAGDTGIKHMRKRLSKDEQVQLMHEMQAKGGIDAPLEGLSERQRVVAERHQELMKTAWDEYNAWRQEVGLKPIKGINNYYVDSFTGEYKALVRAPDETGNLKTIGVISENSFKAAQEARAAVLEKLGEIEGIEIGEVKHNPTNIVKSAKEGDGRVASRFSNFDRFAEIVELMEETHPLAKEVQATLAKHKEERAMHRSQFYVHYKKKTGAFGSEGNKFWKDDLENAQAFFEAQDAYIEGLYNYLAFRKSTKTLNEMLNLDINRPRGKEYLTEYLNAAYGYTFGKDITNRIVTNIAGLTGTASGTWFRYGNAAINNLTRSTLALNGYFAALQGMQLVQSTPALHASLKTHGIKGHSIWAETVGTQDLFMASLAVRGIKGAELFISEPGKYAIQYMRDNHISTPRIIEDVAFGTNFWKDIKSGSVTLADPVKYIWGHSKGLADWSISAPETIIRGQMFMSTYHYALSAGWPKEQAVRLADRATDLWLGNFTLSEKAKVFNEMGAIGKSSGQMQTFTMNILSQYYNALSNKEFATLGVMLAAQATLFGYMGLPGLELADEVMSWARRTFNMPNMKTIKEMALENPDTLAPYGGVNWALAALGFDADMQVRGSQADLIRTDPAEMVFTLQRKALQIGEAGLEAGKALGRAAGGETLNRRKVASPLWEIAPGALKGSLEDSVYSEKNKNTGKRKFFNPRKEGLELVYDRELKDSIARVLGGRTQSERFHTEGAYVAQRKQKDMNEIKGNLADKITSLISRAIYEPRSKEGKEALIKQAAEKMADYKVAAGTKDMDDFIETAGNRYSLTPLQLRILKKSSTDSDYTMLTTLAKMIAAGEERKQNAAR